MNTINFSIFWKDVISRINAFELEIFIDSYDDNSSKCDTFYNIYIQMNGNSLISSHSFKQELKREQILIVPIERNREITCSTCDQNHDLIVISLNLNHINIYRGISNKDDHTIKDSMNCILKNPFSIALNDIIKLITKYRSMNDGLKISQILFHSFLLGIKTSPEFDSDFIYNSDYFHPLVKKGINYIESNFSLTICSVQHIAKEIGCSPNYLSNIFLQNIGMNLHQYINNFRMNHAKLLIVNSENNVTEISHACGFENVSYFIKQFKKVHGVTPKKMILNNVVKTESVYIQKEILKNTNQ